MERLDAPAIILQVGRFGLEQQPEMLQKSIGVKWLNDFQLSPYGSSALVA